MRVKLCKKGATVYYDEDEHVFIVETIIDVDGKERILVAKGDLLLRPKTLYFNVGEETYEN